MSSASAMRGKRTGAQITKVQRDADGFENISDFWDASEIPSSPFSGASTGRRSSADRKSLMSIATDDSFDYDTSSSISEEEEEEEDEKPPASTQRARQGRKSSVDTAKSSRGASLGSTLPLEDSINTSMDISRSSAKSKRGSGDKSPFSVGGASPVKEQTSARDGAEGRGADFDQPDFEDNFYMMDDADDNAFPDTPAPASSDKKSRAGSTSAGRRVSFGKDTKPAVSKAKAAASLSKSSSSSSSTPDNKRMSIGTPGSNEFTRGRALPDDSYVEEEEEEEDTDGEDQSGFTDSSFMSEVRKKKASSSYIDDPSLDGDEDDGEVRRSRRATKGMKFAFWKGERAVYDHGKIVGMLKANPTPAKSKKRPAGGEARKGILKLRYDDGAEQEEAPVVLPRGVRFMDRQLADELQVWDDETEDSKRMRVVSFKESLYPPSALPITAARPPGKNKVGFAAQSFNVPEAPGLMSGWITGFVELPAGAIKDAEGVGECAQVFFVSECQDDGLELGIADPKVAEWSDKTAQRQLLKKGDSFYVPPGNIYRLENHSASRSAMLYWTIVKPIESASFDAPVAPLSRSK